ncbi:MAG: 2-C-methyl-D-erythritol 4-phosphate cytidylyltransferase [Nitrospira sp.]|nr:2-C-methyl-D-erythritol 4-phosphate cytidylyltransferase [Nitrospira sp.]
MHEWVAAVVPAGGCGTRMGNDTPKQFLQLGDVPLLIHALRVLESSRMISEIVLVVPRDAVPFCQEEFLPPFVLSKISAVIRGGARRQDSVWNGLQAVDERTKIVVVHDAVRPFVTGAMVEQVVDGAVTHGAAIAAIPLHDTVKRAAPDGMIETTLDRQRLWSAQTPQAFRLELLRDAHQASRQDGVEATDDAFLVERIGHRVSIVSGSPDNIKVTRPEDLAMGEAILAARRNRSSS